MDQYQSIKVVGKGTFGQALLVRRKSDSKQFIIKQIQTSSMNEKEKQESLNEVRVLSALNHPNIVKYETSFMHDGKLCIVMEYAEGGDLYQKIKKQQTLGRPFSEETVLDWFIQICLAVKHIHDRKILHRDLKTQNIFLTKHDGIKLGDFGIARVLKSTMECARTLVGTPYYLSPELCQEQPYNNKSDVWSLGCILYELVTLKHAFEGNSMKALIGKILRGIYPPVSSKYSRDLRSMIDSCLQKDPHKRPSINTILKTPFIQQRIQEKLQAAGAVSAAAPTPVPSSAAAAAAAPVSSKQQQQQPIYVAGMQKKPGELGELQKQRDEIEKQRAALYKKEQEQKRYYDEKLQQQQKAQLLAERQKQEAAAAAAAAAAAKKLLVPPRQRIVKPSVVSAAVPSAALPVRASNADRPIRPMFPPPVLPNAPVKQKPAISYEMKQAPQQQQQAREDEIMRRIEQHHHQQHQQQQQQQAKEDALAEYRKRIFWDARKQAEENKKKALLQMQGDAAAAAAAVAAAEAAETPAPAPAPAVVVPPPAAAFAKREEKVESPVPRKDIEAGASAEESKEVKETPAAEQDDDDDENEFFEDESFQDEDDHPHHQDKFKLNGQTLRLSNVSRNDSLMYRIESLRAYMEKELGDEAFLKIYRILANQAQDDDDDAQEKSVEDILGKDNLGFV